MPERHGRQFAEYITYLIQMLLEFASGAQLTKWSLFHVKAWRRTNEEPLRQTSNIRRTLTDDKSIDNSDVVGASPVGAAPTTSFGLTPVFNRLRKDNCNTRRETFKFWDLVRLIL